MSRILDPDQDPAIKETPPPPLIAYTSQAVVMSRVYDFSFHDYLNLRLSETLKKEKRRSAPPLTTNRYGM
jgi:hypothetical protein